MNAYLLLNEKEMIMMRQNRNKRIRRVRAAEPGLFEDSSELEDLVETPAVPEEEDNLSPSKGETESRYPAELADAYTLYLREIGQTKLLTPKEEVALAKRIQKGDENARQEMIKANLRLVVKIARDYEGYGLPLFDLINEGNIGLMKAVARFDPTKGAKLSTYASRWIKQGIRRALNKLRKMIEKREAIRIAA